MDVVTLLFFDLHHANCEMQLSHFRVVERVKSNVFMQSVALLKIC